MQNSSPIKTLFSVTSFTGKPATKIPTKLSAMRKVVGVTTILLTSMTASAFAKAMQDVPMQDVRTQDVRTQNANIEQSNPSKANQYLEKYNEVNLNDVNSGALLFKQLGSKHFLEAPRLKTEVDINIEGMVANVKVKQKFTNTSNEWQHALYAFPLPDDSAVNHLKIVVAERVIVGEIQEKQKALKTFNAAKKKGQKAALVQQYRPNLFSTQVANIPPNETIEVEISYFQQVNYQSGEFSLDFPMAITPRYQPNHSPQFAGNSLPELIFQARSPHDLHVSDSSDNKHDSLIDMNISLSAGAELASVDSVNHTLIVKQDGSKHGDYSLKLSNQIMDRDFVLTWEYSEKVLPQFLNFQQQYQGQHYGLLMVLPGLSDDEANSTFSSHLNASADHSAVFKSKTNISRELTFIVDTSGSMAGQSLSQAKQAFNYALKTLTQADSFQVVSFNSYPTKLFDTSVAATESNKSNAWQYVKGLTSTGGTEIKSALAMVLEEAPVNSRNDLGNNPHNERLQQIVFLTDGAVGNEAEIFSYIEKKIKDKRLFTVGLGTAPNRYFMKKSAEIGRGSYQFISHSNHLVKQMKQLFVKLSNPVLTDLTLKANNANSGLVTTPNPIPDVYQDEPLFLSYKINDNQTDSLLTGMYKGSVWSLNIEQPELLEESVTTNNIPPLATLWARRKIADHYRQLMLFKDDKAKDNIIELALKHQLVTPFTSLVAVEKEASRLPNEKAQAKQLTNKLPAGQKLPSTSLLWQWQFYVSLALLSLSLLFLFFITWQDKVEQDVSEKNNDA